MKKIYKVIILLTTFTYLSLPVYGEIIYPNYTGERVVDLSGKFKSDYISKVNTQLSNVEFETRIVFIKTEGKINLAFYAPKLFEKWNMSDESILVVVDPYLNKIGYGLGKNVRSLMSKRQKVIVDSQDSSTNKNIIDYDNIVSAIKDRFSEDEIVAKQKQNVIKDKPKVKSTYREINNNVSLNSFVIDYKLLFIALFIFSSILIGVFLFNKNRNHKRNLELKTTYTFDSDIQKQDISQMLEKISKDLEKNKLYTGATLKDLLSHIDNLKKVKKETEKFLIKFDAEFSEVDIDNIGAIRDLLDEGNLLLDKLNQVHKDSVKQRKEIKSIFEKSDMVLSDVRVNIEQSRINLEEIKTIYSFPLDYSEQKIQNIESLMENAKEFLLRNDPYEFRNRLNNIHYEIKSLKREFDIIPHLYKQLKDDLPLNIDSFLEESLLDPVQKSKLRAQIYDLRSNALILLSKGELEKTESLLKDIFDKMTNVKTSNKLIN